MKNLKIILILIIPLFTFSCSTSTKNEIKDVHDNTEEESLFGISDLDGVYTIDTSIILSNRNLDYLITKLENTELKNKDSYEESPKIVQTLMDSLTKGFDIANPGEDWQVGCLSLKIGKMIENKINDSITEISFDDSKLIPSRQLIYLGISKNMTLMAYYTGGMGKSEHILIIRHGKDKILDLWSGNTLVDLKDKKEIIKFLKENKDEKWGLNTNIIYM